MNDVPGDRRVVPITDPIAYPLHRKRLSVAQRHGRTAGLVVGSLACVVGAMVIVGAVRERNAAVIAVGVAVAMSGVVACFAGTALSTFRASSGLITLRPDRVEIADDRSLPEPLVLLRHQILAICPFGMVDEQPSFRAHVGHTHDMMQLGEERPNVEIWLVTPISRTWPPPLPGRPHRPVAVLAMQTPGAGTMIRWFREGLTEVLPPKWYEGDIPTGPYGQ